MIHILPTCAKVGIDVSQDSNNLQSGPFPDEVLEVGNCIGELMSDRKYDKPVLWNFMYFLYEWSCLSRYITWDEFTRKLISRKIFTSAEVADFSMKAVMDRINGEMLSWIETLKYNCVKTFKGSRSGLL